METMESRKMEGMLFSFFKSCLVAPEKYFFQIINLVWKFYSENFAILNIKVK